MGRENIGPRASPEELSQVIQDVMPIVGMMISVSMLRRMLFQLETERLRSILGREPDEEDRFFYQLYLADATTARAWQQRCSDLAKLRDAAWRDAAWR